MPKRLPSLRMVSQMRPASSRLAEDLVAALAGVAGARNRDGAAEQRRRHVVKVFQARECRARAWTENRPRRGPCSDRSCRSSSTIMAALRPTTYSVEGLVAGAAAVHHHPGIRARAVQHAVLDEMPGVVQHAGIRGLARVDLGDVAGRRVIQDGRGMRTDQVQLLQARHVHQSGLGADRHVILRHVLGIGPRRAHAVPILELRAERAMPIGQNRGDAN